MTDITNAQLAAQISELVAYWRTRDLEFQGWLAGSATGGPYSDGRYPLTDYLETTYYVKSPAALQDSVTGMVDSASSYATAAAASQAAAATSKTGADTARDVAVAARDAAVAARDAASTSQSTAATLAANAQTYATSAYNSAATATSAAATATQAATDADADRIAAQAAAAAAQASATSAATFDPNLFYSKTASDSRYRQSSVAVPWADLSGVPSTFTPSAHSHVISDVTNLQTSLDAKAPLASPALSGTPTAPTAASGTNTTQIATTAFVRGEVSALVGAAPGTLDTLNELASALGNDPNFATTVTNSLAGKAPLTGTGASGTWNISVTGSAGSVAWTNVTSRPTALSSFTNDSGFITGITSGMVTGALGYTPYNSSNPSGYITSSALSSYLPLSGGTLTGELYLPNLTVGGQGRSSLNAIGGNIGATAGSWNNSQLELKCTDGGTVALSFHRAGYTAHTIEVRDGNGLQVNGNAILNAANYNSYAPSLTGSGASGTWGISITGNAATATSATDSTKLPLIGGTLTGALTWAASAGLGNGNARSLVTGYSGGNYGQTGYGISYTTTSGLHNYAINDIVSMWEAYDGIRVYAAPGGTVGTPITWTTVLDARRNNSSMIFKGQTVLDAANYSSYALPLSGGTISSGSGYPLILNTTQRYTLWLRNTAASGTGWWLTHDADGRFVVHGNGVGDRAALDSSGNWYASGQMYATGSQHLVLNTGNYTSYSPSLTGSGATGTWGISITGNAATVTNGLYKSGVNTIPAAIQLNTTTDNWMWHLQASSGNEWYWGPSTANFGIGANRLAISSSGGSANSELVLERGTTRLLEVLQANLQYKGNVVLHAGNYSSYALPLSGGTISSTNDQILTLNKSSGTGWNYIGFSHGGTRRFYFGLNSDFEPTLGADNGGAFRVLGSMTVAGSTVLTASNYSSYALPLSGGNLTGQTTLTAGHGNTRFQLRYNHDGDPNSGGAGYLTLWASEPGISYAYTGIGANINIGGQYYGRQSTGQTYGLYIRFDTSSGQTQFWNTTATPGPIGGQGTMRAIVAADGEFYATSSTHKVLHAGNYSSYALPLSGGTLTGTVYVGTSGSSSSTRALRVGPSGSSPASFGSYSGSWRSAIEIWDNAATRMLHLTPPDGTNFGFSSIKSVGGGLRLDVGSDGATNAVQIGDSGAVALSNSLTMNSGGIASNAWSSSTPNEAVRVFAPQGGSASWDGAITGAIKIRLPQRAYNSMWHMTVKIYDYDASVAEYRIGNYAYSAGGYQSAAAFVGSGSAPPRTVRIGNDGSYDCVWIGETSSGWSYPVVAVTEFFAGFRGGNSAAWANNWNVSYVTSFGTVATTITPTVRLAGGSTINGDAILHASNYSSYALPLSGGTMTGAIYSNSGSLIIGQNGGVIRGYLFNDTTGFGILNNGGGWAAYVPLGTSNWQVNGSITASGNVTAYSDERVKANWRKLDDGFLVKLSSVRAGIYDRTDVEITQVGVSAQSLRDVLPHAVIESEEGDLSVAYGNAALVSAVELAKEVVALRHEVEQLKQQLH